MILLGFSVVYAEDPGKILDPAKLKVYEPGAYSDVYPYFALGLKDPKTYNPSTVIKGKEYTYSIKLNNVGSADAGPSYMRFKLQAKIMTWPDPASPVWVSDFIPTPEVLKGKQIFVKGKVRYPSVTVSGQYELWVNVGCDNKDCENAYATEINGKKHRPNRAAKMDVTVQ